MTSGGTPALRSRSPQDRLRSWAVPVVVAPVQNVGREWRFIVVNKGIVTGSAYDPATRSAIADTLDSNACSVAQAIAASLPSPADLYVLDLCESDGALRLLKLNPFGGADLYACDPSIVVESVARAAREAWLRKNNGPEPQIATEWRIGSVLMAAGLAAAG